MNRQLLLGLALGAALATATSTLADSLIWDRNGKAYLRQEMLNPHQAPLLWGPAGQGLPGQPREVPLGVPGGRPC